MAFIGNNPKSITRTYTPQSSVPSNPAEGMVFRSDGTALPKGLYEYKDSLWQSVGTSGVDLNYIVDGDAEAGVSNYSEYADAAGTSPVDGEGGSANVTFTQSSSSPLRGLNSFVLTKDAADRQGEGVAKDFDIDAADVASMLRISFDASTSANYADGDVRVYIISSSDNFVSDFNVIEPVPTELYAGDGQFQASFQTDASDTDYRLCFHVASTNAAAYTVKIDNIKVEASKFAYGVPATDWETYTPTTNFTGGTSTLTAKSRRVGDSLEISGHLVASGTGGGETVNMSLPSGLSIDTAKMSSTNSAYSQVGMMRFYDGATTLTDMHYTAYTSDTAVRFITRAGVNVLGSTITSGDSIYFTALVPIVGWSSNTLMSDQADGRLLAAKASTNAANTIANATLTFIDFEDTDYDTAGAILGAGGGVTTSVGTGWRYVIPSSGKYDISALVSFTAYSASAAIALYIYKNSSSVYTNNVYTSATSFNWSINGNTTIDCVKGDVIQIATYQNSTSSQTLYNSGSRNCVSIQKVQGPSQITAGEKVKAVYTDTTGQSIVDTNTVAFGTKLIDTHAAVTSNVFTAPRSGYADIFAQICTGDVSASVGNVLELWLYKNSSTLVSRGITIDVTSTASKSYTATLTDTIEVVKGDTLELKFFETFPASIVSATANRNRFIITMD